MEFNKKIFAILLEKAKGERSWRRFAMDCDISYVQMRKLAFCEQENPPRQKLLLKLGANSENGISYEDFLCAAGSGVNQDKVLSPSEKRLIASYEKLKPKSQKELEDFAEFLLTKNDND